MNTVGQYCIFWLQRFHLRATQRAKPDYPLSANRESELRLENTLGAGQEKNRCDKPEHTWAKMARIDAGVATQVNNRRD